MRDLRTALLGLLSALALSATAEAATVSLTSPTNNQVYTAPASVSLKASTSGTGIAKVEFYQGTTLIGSDSTSPYSLTWSNAPAGSYSLTAKAKNSAGTVLATSSAVAIVVNAPPTVSLTSPTANQGFATGSNIVLTANAADGDGSVSKVEFYRGTTLIGTATTSPYTVTWSNAPAGSYSLTAKATDNRGATKTSTAVAIVVAAPPTVTLTGPAANQFYAAPANVTLTASASPGSGGTLSKVEFYRGSTLIGTATSAPYSVIWSNVPAGSYSLTAKATDNRGISTSSAAVAISVNAAGPAQGMYFIHPDHLGTPRVITNEANQVVWRWDNDEPFGDNPANADPQSTGSSFPFNLRYPGQYFDQETGTHYNYHRYFDPGTGRYTTPDPLGLAGGDLSLYNYARQNPLSNTDPTGEAVFVLPALPAIGSWLAANAANIGIGAGLGVLMSIPSDNPNEQSSTGQKQREYEQYKNICNQPQPPGLDKCGAAKWRLNKARQCKQLRQQWDDKWMPGRHSQAIQEMENAIRNAEADIQKYCGGCP